MIRCLASVLCRASIKTGEDVEVSAPRSDKTCCPSRLPVLGITRNGSCIVIVRILDESFDFAQSVAAKRPLTMYDLPAPPTPQSPNGASAAFVLQLGLQSL